MPIDLSISGILNLVDNLDTKDPLKSSHVIPPSEALIYLSLCLSLSMRAWVSSEVGVGMVTGGGANSV